MPPISLLDDYDACMYDLEPLYCTMELELVSDTPSDLLNLIRAHETKEINDCRRYWLWNLMYMTNYKDGSHCMPHGWYLAADMQLYCLGVVILILARKSFWRKVVLGSMLLIGIVTPAIPTYIYNLDTLLNLSPQSLRNYAVDEPTFEFLYKHSYTNLANYTIGIITGIYLHHWQKNKCDVNKFKVVVV
ncbi:unnamed protein product, partial [Iphiclides podalirius]